MRGKTADILSCQYYSGNDCFYNNKFYLILIPPFCFLTLCRCRGTNWKWFVSKGEIFQIFHSMCQLKLGLHIRYFKKWHLETWKNRNCNSHNFNISPTTQISCYTITSKTFFISISLWNVKFFKSEIKSARVHYRWEFEFSESNFGINHIFESETEILRLQLYLHSYEKFIRPTQNITYFRRDKFAW